MRTALWGLLFCCWAFTAFGQPKGMQAIEQELEQPLNDSARISMMTDLAGEFQGSGSMREATHLFWKAYQLADSLHTPYLMHQTATDYAENLLDRDRPDSALAVLKKTMEAFPDYHLAHHLWDLTGTAYRFKSDFPKALDAYNRAMAEVDSLENASRYAAIYQNIGIVHENMGNKGLALKHYLEGVDYAESAGDSVFLATALNNLGELYNQYEEAESAEYYLERSREISRDINYRAGLLWAVSNLANTKKKLLELEEALALYNEALALHEEVRFNTPPFRLIYNIGDLHLLMGDLDQAEKNFRESLRHSEERDIAQGLYFNNNGLARVAEQRGELESAVTYVKNALRVARELGYARFAERSAERLYTLHRELGNYRRALAYHEQFKTTADSLRQMEAELRLSETEAQLDLRREQQVNELLLEKQQEQQALIATQNWLIAAGVAIIILILITVVLLYRSKVEKQRVNDELQEQQDKLRQMNSVKDKMLAIIAHDLRSPLSSMQGMLYLLREDDLTQQEIETMAVQMELSLSQNISMMDNLLAWAREQMSGLAVDLQTVSGRDIVEEVFANFDFTATQKGVRLINNIEADLKVRADYNLLKLIIRNLVANSIKFTRRGDAITVSTRESGGKIVFEVNDTGIGIPEEDQRNLFTMYGASREGTANEKGSGLGLQLCKEFVEKQNGEIAVQSTEGKGTTFSFTLPRAS